MKCHYEVLDVQRDAAELEIKVAYRKLALKWHPDKNLENSEYAKEQFQIVQQAYEVLSDRQERAWYDNHREQILRGSSSEFEDKSLDVFHYFNTQCFNGYDDGEKSFYTVYRNVFESIAKEDMEFMEDKEEFCQVPSFGNSKTDYEKVSEFYNYWLNYSTKKSYVWLDPYDIAGARDRRYVKLVEKENKKVRQKAKKERNEEVRNLVVFVRKRDKRVQAQKKIQEQMILENKKKRELMSKKKRLERQQELNDSGSQPEWAKFDNVKSELEEIEKNLAEQFGEDFSDPDSDEEDEDYSNLYCVACNKVFKTIKAFENHELSKKHKENVVLLKEVLLNENDLDEKADHAEEDILEKSFEDTDISYDSEPSEVIHIKSKKKKKNRNVLSVDLEGACPINLSQNIFVQEDEKCNDNSEVTLNKKPKRRNKKNNCNKMTLNNGKQQETDSSRKIKGNKKTKDSQNNLDIDTDHNCVTCKSSFPSKNKLFDHLKKTGHSVYLPNDRIKSKHVKEI